MTLKNIVRKKSDVEALREICNRAFALFKLDEARAKARWDNAVNPFVAISEYCTRGMRAHRGEVYGEYLRAAAALAEAERAAKKKGAPT